MTASPRLTRDAIATLLVSRTALTELDQASALAIVAYMKPRRYAAGSVIFSEGSEDASHLILVISGDALVESGSGSPNDSMVLGILGPGHMVGEMGVIDGEKRSASVVATTPVEAAVLDASAMQLLIEKDPKTGCALLAALLRRTSQRLRIANKKLQTSVAISRAMDKQLDAVNSVLDREIQKKKEAYKTVARPKGQVVIGDVSSYAAPAR